MSKKLLDPNTSSLMQIFNSFCVVVHDASQNSLPDPKQSLMKNVQIRRKQLYPAERDSLSVRITRRITQSLADKE